MTRQLDPARFVAGALILGALLTAGLSAAGEPAGPDDQVIPPPVLTNATPAGSRDQVIDEASEDPFLDELTRCLQDLAILARNETVPARPVTSRPDSAKSAAPGDTGASGEKEARDARGAKGEWLRPQRVALTRLSPAMIERCLEVASDIDEQLAVQLAVLRERDPARFEKQLRKSRRLVALAELKKHDAVLYDLKLHELKVDARVNELARQVRLAHAERRESDARVLEQHLRREVILQIAFRHNTREDYLCRLREIAERLEEELEHDRKHFPEMLERRMMELKSKKPPE